MNREQFLARKNVKATDTVTLADGAAVKIRKLTQGEVEHVRRHYAKPEQGLASLRYIVCTCVLNDDGTPMFTADDLNDLAALSYADVDTIARAVGRFSGTAQLAAAE